MKVKGLSILGFLDGLEAVRGLEIRETALSQLDDPLQSELRYGGIVANGWYPLEYYQQLMRAARQATGEGTSLIRQITAQKYSRDIKGVYRPMLRLLSNELLIRGLALVFGNYYDAGRVEFEKTGERSGRAHFRECSGFDENNWEAVFAAVETLLGIANRNNVRLLRLSGGRNGNTDLSLAATWD